MAISDLRASLGPIELRSPLIAASGTVGAVSEWAMIADVSYYGAAVAKSVSGEPWAGRPSPRVAPTTAGMLNGIGIQNPGIEEWIETHAGSIRKSSVPVWGSAVGNSPDEFARVARGLAFSGVEAIEVNLSCPNLEDGEIFSFKAEMAANVVERVAKSTSLPIGAKLSPNTPDLVAVSESCLSAGASFLVLTNTALGLGVSVETRKPVLSGGVGGYSGPGLKPLSLRCVYEVSRALPSAPIVGCGGVSTGRDVVEYLLAGASAVALGTVHLAEPKAGRRVFSELQQRMKRMNVTRIADLVGAMTSW